MHVLSARAPLPNYAASHPGKLQFLQHDRMKACHGSGFLYDHLPRKPGFDARTVRVEFLAVRGALGQAFIPVLRLSSVSAVPRSLYTHMSPTV